MPSRILIFVGFMLAVSACGGDSKPAVVTVADRVFLNGAVYTVDAERSWAEAVAIKDGKIIYVGDDEGAGSHITTETEIVDLVGQMLLPGFHDAHAHILTGMFADEASPRSPGCCWIRPPTSRSVDESRPYSRATHPLQRTKHCSGASRPRGLK